jgi:hypothetical protein
LTLDHTTIFRWVQRYAPEIDRRSRPHLKPTNDSWRVDETYVKVGGQWMYLCRAVDSTGQTLDFLLNETRSTRAAKRFLRKVLGGPQRVAPRVINVDLNAAYIGVHHVNFRIAVALRHKGDLAAIRRSDWGVMGPLVSQVAAVGPIGFDRVNIPNAVMNRHKQQAGGAFAGPAAAEVPSVSSSNKAGTASKSLLMAITS